VIAMNTIGLVARPDFAAGLKYARKLLVFLENKKLKVLLPPHLAKALKCQESSCSLSDMQADVVVTLGGDGTLLFTARNLPPGVPLLPINLQSFGFLSECEIKEAMDFIGKVLDGEIKVQETLRLAIWSTEERLPDAVNEAYLSPDELGHPMKINLQVGDNASIAFQADGLIVSTPTGSTGQARSLGGPVIDPQLDVFLITPVAPLRQSFLPLIVSADNILRINVGRTAHLVIDGDPNFRVLPETQIAVRRSEHPLNVFRHPNSFYSRLQRKFLRC